MTTAIAEHTRRTEKLEHIRAQGIDPFPHLQDQGHRTLIAKLVKRHDPAAMRGGIYADLRYQLAGRLIGRRKHGKATRFELRDRSGTLQIYARHAPTPRASSTVNVLDCDLGDIVSVTGCIYVTPREELGLDVESCTLLAKALHRPPADDRDLGSRSAGCELKLLASSAHRALLAKRASAMRAIREWMAIHDFIEVETPVLQTLAGGAAAHPFVTHAKALGREVSLRFSTQLSLQRCTVGEIERVYELGKCFRNEGISREHNPEFTMLEWLAAYTDYRDASTFAEGLITHVAEIVSGKRQTLYRRNEISFARPWRRVTLRRAIADRTGLDILESTHAELAAVAPVDNGPGESWAAAVERIYSRMVQPSLMQPTIVYDFPLDAHPCLKRHKTTRQLGESFDVIVGGTEIASGGTDLTDPHEQWRRFVHQSGANRADGDPHPDARDYVNALQYGCPPTAGAGIGVDRLLMILLDCHDLRGTILFPLRR